MKRTTRRILVTIAFVSFFIGSAILVFYAMGYRYDNQTKQIRQVGIIDVATTPKATTITVNGQTKDETSPVQIMDLTPKEYEVTVKKENYTTWTKKVSVNSRKVTWIRNVLLMLKDQKPESIAENILETKTSDGNNFIALRTENSLTIINTENLEKKSIDLSEENKDLTIKNVSNQGEVLITTKTEEDTKLFISTETSLQEIELETTNLQDIHLHNDSIFYTKEGSLFSFNIKNQEENRIAENVTAFTITKDDIYFATQQSKKHTISKKPHESIINFINNNIQEVTNHNTPITKIAISSDEDIAFITNKKEVVKFDEQKKENLKIASNINDIKFGNASSKLLLFNESEISFYDTNKNNNDTTNQAYAFNQLNVITRYSKSIQDAGWFPGDAWVWIIFDSGIKFIELDERHQRNTIDLLPNTNLANITFQNEGEEMIFTNTQENSLNKVILFEK